uniref:Beta-amylase n=1 Tax=Leersia perrieri TaxID=77586 RepID=A0A0D9X2N6_9ORYZ
MESVLTTPPFAARCRVRLNSGCSPANFRLSPSRSRRAGDLRAAGLGSFLGYATGDHKNKNHEVDDVAAPARLFVGLPIDTVTDGGAAAANKARGIAAGMRAMKLLGVDGVELPVFWSVAQPDSPDRFAWAGYRAVADMARDEGLCLRVTLHFHGSPTAGAGAGGGVPMLPVWVATAAADDPDIVFTDRSGGRHEDCLSFAVDELPVLHGRSPLDCYEAFFRSFAENFKDLFDSTITDVTVGLGPNGELRYPSYPPGTDGRGFTGVGEFQCYDKYMLSRLRRHAADSGHPLWGLSGPHDAPLYSDDSPDSSGFFTDSGSWRTPYGDFFLSWYSGELVSHGHRVLSLTNSILPNSAAGGIELSAKVPFMHWWHGAASRPAEAAAGLYKIGGKKNGYSPAAKMFAANLCTMIIPGMDVCMNKQRSRISGSSPDKLMVQIKNACRRHGARIAGENASLVVTHTSSFSRIRSNVVTAERVRPGHFTYQRMGEEFFSPEHWPAFVEFVRGVVCGEWDGDGDEDEQGEDGGDDVGRDVASSSNAREAQAV